MSAGKMDGGSGEARGRRARRRVRRILRCRFRQEGPAAGAGARAMSEEKWVKRREKGVRRRMDPTLP